MRMLCLVLAVLCGCGRSALLDGGDAVSSRLVNIHINGLYTFANDVDGVPEGALTIAENVVIDREDVLEPRPGFPPYTATFGSGTSRAKKLYWFNGFLLAQYDSAIAYYDGSAWHPYTGTFANPDTGIRPQGVVANQSFYVATAAGVQVLDSITGTFRAAGVPKALDGQAAIATGSGTAVNANAQAAYRHLFGYRDANNYLKLGAPSGRVVVANPAAQSYAIGALAKAASATVTATSTTVHGLVVGQTITLSPGETNFPAGTYTVASVPSTTTFTFVAGSSTTATSTAAQTISPVTANVTYTARIPSGVAANYILQVYRTASSADANTDPGDDEQLVYEYVLTNVDIAAGTVTVADVSPDGMRGALIHTAANLAGGTVAMENDPPPLARAMASFKGSTFYANTTPPQSIDISFIGLPNLFDQLNIISADATAHVVMQADTTESLSGPVKYIRFSSGSAAQNIANTARSFVKQLNAQTTLPGVRATYVSGPEDPPGRVHIEFPTVAVTVYFDVLASTGTTSADYFSPAAPGFNAPQTLSRTGSTVTVTCRNGHMLQVGQTVTLASQSPDANFPIGTKTVASVIDVTHFTYTEAGTATSISPVGTGTYAMTNRGSLVAVDVFGGYSSNYLHTSAATQKNGLAWSKTNQPDAVPPAYATTVGAADKAILAMVPLRDSLFVFKEDGLFRVNGGGGVFSVEDFDRTVRLLCAESAVPFENQVFALTDQGVVAIAEQGTPRVVSRPIEDKLPRNYSTNLTANGFAIAHESKRRYILFSDLDGSGKPTGAYVYNAFTDTWVHWTLARTAAVLDPVGDFLYLGDGAANDVTRDTKAGTFLDYYDGSFTTTGGLINSTTVSLDSGSANVGDVIYDIGFGWYSVATSSGSSPTISPAQSNSGGQIIVYRGFPVDVQWAPITAGNPSAIKQFWEASFLFRQAAFTAANLVFTTDFVSAQSTAVPGTSATASGVSVVAPIVVWLPQQAQMATQLRPEFQMTNALGAFQMEGIALRFTPLNGGTRR